MFWGKIPFCSFLPHSIAHGCLVAYLGMTAVMVIGHDDMGVMGICRCRLSLPKERNPFRQCKEKGIGRGINGGIPTDLLIDETKDEDIFGSHLQEAPFLKVLPGR